MPVSDERIAEIVKLAEKEVPLDSKFPIGDAMQCMMDFGKCVKDIAAICRELLERRKVEPERSEPCPPS